jgi:hypothetical protein
MARVSISLLMLSLHEGSFMARSSSPAPRSAAQT